MYVGEDDLGGVVLEGFFHDFAGMNGGAVDGTAEEVLSGDEAAVVVEIDQGEDFVRELGESGDEIVGGDSGRGESGAAARFTIERVAGGGHDFVESRLAVAGGGVGVGDV